MKRTITEGSESEAQTGVQRTQRWRKRKKAQTVTVSLPTTAGELREPREKQRYHDSVIICDENGRIMIWFQKSKVGKKKLNELYNSTKWLEGKVDIPIECTNRSDQEKSLHIGCWRKCKKVPELTQATRDNPEVKTWIERNTPLFKSFGNMFERSFKSLYNSYMGVGDLPIRLGAWSTCAINFNFGPLKKHFDKNDYRKGLCWDTTFGKYTGGELHFTQLNITIGIQPGDIIAFRSWELEHEVLPYVGERYSLVMFQHHDMFFKAE